MTMINISTRRELFVDHFLIDRLDQTVLRLHEPVSDGVVIKIDQTWEGPANFGVSVFAHRGRHLLYYRAMTVNQGDDRGVLCVAVSDDGITWTKPALGLVTSAGCRETNIIATDDGKAVFQYNGAPWFDTRPGVPEDERIKAQVIQPVSGEEQTAINDPVGPKCVVFYGSADGFTFHKLDPQPDLVSHLQGCFDGGNTMFWSAAEQQYVFYYRIFDQGRSMARATSPDLQHWTESVPMAYGEAPREQFYINNTQPYFRAPHLYVAPAARFMEGRRAITEAQGAAVGLVSAIGAFQWDWTRDCSDAVLLTSRAGSTRYDRTFMETFIRPGLGASNWVSRTNYPVTGILPCGPDRMMMFVTRHYLQNSWHIERLLLRTDGFASVTAPWRGGQMLTKPLLFSGQELEINYRTSAPGFVRVEIQDTAGQPISGYTLADCPEIIGDEIERRVAWKQGADVSRLAGQPVRLRFVMKDADLFALRFMQENSSAGLEKL